MSKKRAPTALDKAELAFKQAERAAKQGDQVGADRWLKTAEKMSIVAERIAAANAAEPEPDNIEEIRAETRARIARYITVSHETEEWEFRRDVRNAVAAFAREHGLPEPPEIEPLPPHSEEAAIATLHGKYYPLPRKEPIIPLRVRRRLGLPEETFDGDPLEPGSEQRRD